MIDLRNYLLQIAWLMHVLLFQLHDLNAQLILNVPSTLHVFKRNVKILVFQLFVGKMLNAEQIITVPFVYVAQDLLGILTLSVKNVSSDS